MFTESYPLITLNPVACGSCYAERHLYNWQYNMSFIQSITKPCANLAIIYAMPGMGKTTYRRRLMQYCDPVVRGIIAAYDTDDFPLDNDKELMAAVTSIVKGHSAAIYILFTNRYRIVSELVRAGAALITAGKWSRNPDTISYAGSLVAARGSNVRLYDFDKWLASQSLARFAARFPSALTIVDDCASQAIMWLNTTHRLVKWLFSGLPNAAPYLSLTVEGLLQRFSEEGWIQAINDDRNPHTEYQATPLLIDAIQPKEK